MTLILELKKYFSFIFAYTLYFKQQHVTMELTIAKFFLMKSFGLFKLNSFFSLIYISERI